MFHNEFVNIWTMLIGLAIFTFLSAYTLDKLSPPSLYSGMEEEVVSHWDASHEEQLRSRHSLTLRELLTGKNGTNSTSGGTYDELISDEVRE